MGCRDDAHIHLDRGCASYPVEFAIGQNPQEAGLSVSGHITDFVQEQGATVGLFEPALASGASAGEGTLFVAEEFGFNQVFGNCSHVQGNEGMVRPGAVVVQRLGHQFLTRAAFAVDEDRDVGVRKPANSPEDFLHGRRFTDDFGVALGHFGLGFTTGTLLMAVGHGALDQCDRVIHIERLGKVFEGTGLVAGYGALQIRVRGHDDDRHVWVNVHNLGQQGDAVDARHSDIAHDGIGLFVFQPHHDAFTTVKNSGLHTGLVKGALQHPANTAVVVYDPDVRRLAHGVSSRGRKMMKSVRPGSLSHSTSPRCWPMMLWVMERPRPVPLARPLIIG